MKRARTPCELAVAASRALLGTGLHTLLSALLALWLVGCAKELSELQPFPCAKDGTCPGGLSCIPNLGCAQPQVDTPCTRATRCDLAAPGAQCTFGVCAPECGGATSPSRGCGNGRVCSHASAPGACLLDCGGGQSCPGGLVCKPLWYQGRRACMPPTEGPPACASFERGASCTRCGSSRFSTVQCTGFTCPENATCGANRTCVCGTGYAPQTCDGRACGGSPNPCTGYAWWCKPNTAPPAPSCSADPQLVSGTCRCWDGRSLPFACGTTESCEKRCADGCDTVTQDCTDPTSPKCTLLVVDEALETECVPRTGSLGALAVCMRNAEDDTGVGRDDCAPGLFCLGLGVAGTGRVCRSFCRGDAQCARGLRCVPFSERTPPDGLCAQACEFFSTTCGAGLTCGFSSSNDGASFFGACRKRGTLGQGAACEADEDCGADSVCMVRGDRLQCRPLCDPAHPCPGGTPCTMSPVLPSLGYCG